MIFQALEQHNQVSDWLHGLGDVGVALMLIYFRWSAKRDTNRRHDENKEVNQQVLKNQQKVISELEAERKYLPQHWHSEWKPEGPDKPLTTDGIIKVPKNGE